MKNNGKYFFIISCIIHASLKLCAQVPDTLPVVKIFSQKNVDITASAITVQELNKNSLSKMNSISIADAVKYFSGVIVKDYGGIGGLKTVSVRSLGANHTGIMYDGILLADAQGGQIDLGKFSLDNIETIQLFNSQPTNILLPARTYASAAILVLTSSTGNNIDDLYKTTMNVKFKTGSFGFINPSLFYKRRVNAHFSHSLDAEYESAKGNYSFVDYETGASKSRRNNSDVKDARFEYDAIYRRNDSNRVKFKTYYYNSKRGLPGAVILYNSFSNQRLNDENFFFQLSWQKNIGAKSRMLINGKYSNDYKYYLDPSYQNNIGRLENKFHQNEFYISAAYNYQIFPCLSFSYAADYFKNKLRRTDQFAGGFANPARNNLLNNISLQWKKKSFEINGNLLHTYITEKVEHGIAANALHAFTPAFSASVQPCNHIPIRLRFFYKNIFRAPTFDDLYFTNIGNTNLRPEYARQYNVGITAMLHPNKILQEIVFTGDAYYNRVTDQILAVPRQNLFQWTTLNIGKTDIKGMDISLHFNFFQWRKNIFSSNLTYSLQQALDVSNPLSSSYKTQLSYTPRHSGSANLNLTRNNLTVSYNILASSYRYRLGDQIADNLVHAFTTHDISIGYTTRSQRTWNYKFIAEANNVYNLQYEIIKYYPMPRFNYRLGILASFKK